MEGGSCCDMRELMLVARNGIVRNGIVCILTT